MILDIFNAIYDFCSLPIVQKIGNFCFVTAFFAFVFYHACRLSLGLLILFFYLCVVPFCYGAIVAISIVTFPITLVLKLKGYNTRFFYPVAVDHLLNIPCYLFDFYYKCVNSIKSYFDSKVEARNSKKKTKENQKEKKNTNNKATNFTNKPSPWEILGLKQGASREEIIKAYKAKMSQNHPDKVANMDKEIQELALQRAKLINEAYGHLIS